MDQAKQLRMKAAAVVEFLEDIRTPPVSGEQNMWMEVLYRAISDIAEIQIGIARSKMNPSLSGATDPSGFISSKSFEPVAEMNGVSPDVVAMAVSSVGLIDLPDWVEFENINMGAIHGAVNSRLASIQSSGIRDYRKYREYEATGMDYDEAVLSDDGQTGLRGQVSSEIGWTGD